MNRWFVVPNLSVVQAKISNSKRRKELGVTQKELAEKLNISDKTLSRWETENKRYVLRRRSYWGMGGKVLKLDFRNTTPFVDDNYYLCYLEVINNSGSFEVHTYLDGEAVSYNSCGI